MLMVDLDMALDPVRNAQELKNPPRVVANPQPCPDFPQLCSLLVYSHFEARLFEKSYGSCQPSRPTA